MPLYEYVCASCQQAQEILVRGGQQPTCPSCGSGDLSKLLSVTARPAAGSGDMAACPPAPSGGFCGRGTCGMQGCGD